MFIDAVERAVRWFQCPTDLAGVKNARYIDRLQLNYWCSGKQTGNCCLFSFGWFPGVWLYMPTFRNTLSVPSSKAFEDGTDRVFRNVGIYKSDAGESPKRKQTTFWTRRKLEIKKLGTVFDKISLEFKQY